VAPIPLSVCIIAHNEEADLPGCLQSVSFADEIVVVDSHSTDRTRELAAAFRGRRRDGGEVAPRVIERDWPGHVEQKNFALSEASHEWVLSLDADERLSPELRREILEILEAGRPDADGYAMQRKNFYLGRWIARGSWTPDRKLRLFRKGVARWGGTNPHDHVVLSGRVRNLKGAIEHYSFKDIANHVRTINSFSDIAAEEMARKGTRHALPRMLLHPPLGFLKSYVLKRGFRDGAAGLVVATMIAFGTFLKYAKLWERRNVKGHSPDRSP
jgi:glycosyltransferase involved in cell wall biosynthesis